jgi:threonylcarbamoyladenosine tRNA methylthiotransferase MtaB
MKIAFTTLGCKTNQYDTDVMVQVCRHAGFDIVPFEGHADVYVINTCTVTSATDAQARNIVRCATRKNPAAKIIVCGCSSQVDPERFKAIEGVSHVLGVRSADELVNILNNLESPHTPLYKRGERGDFTTQDHPEPLRLRSGQAYKGEEMVQNRARALLKIQDGCNNRCAYCIVPFARGGEKSVPSCKVIEEFNGLLESGYREIVLTGIHIGRYGKDLTPRTSLADMLNQLLDGKNDFRIRLSSLDPDELDDKMVEILGNPRVCRHLHLSLQSGCNEVLRMMDRRAEIEAYKERIRSLAQKIPDIAIGSDIITGFPGETDKHHKETIRTMEDLPLAYLHVFPFSPRAGTKAATMPNRVSPRSTKKRTDELLQISARRRKSFYESHIGKKLACVIVSKEQEKGIFKGMSDNYIPVNLTGDEFKYREVYNVNIAYVNKVKVYATHT